MMRNFLKRSSGQILDPQTAEKLLQEVFEACQKEPNTTPADVLRSYRNYRQERYAIQKHVLDAVLLLFFLLPLLFVIPSFSLTPDEHTEPGRPVYQVDVDTFLPVARVTASIDGYSLAVYETDRHTYSVEPTRNGTMTVTVTLANDQYTEHKILVDRVDRTAPSLTSSHQQNGRLRLFLSDTESGVYYDGIYALDPDGVRSEPLFCDPDAGYVEFPCPASTVNIFIPDRTGNLLQLVVSVASQDEG